MNRWPSGVNKPTGNMMIDYKIYENLKEIHERGGQIYRASKFWEMLCDLNISWLKADGIDNFKRTVNNNYFNWMVNSDSNYFKSVSGNFYRRLIKNPRNLIFKLFAKLPPTEVKTYTQGSYRFSRGDRRIYAKYLIILNDYVIRNDQDNLFQNLSEPEHGNPIAIKINDRLISQDLCNSYLEYSYLKNSLGAERFERIKTIAEIGSGYGRLAYQIKQLHSGAAKKLILIDLPPALMVAQWYFKKCFPNESIEWAADYKTPEEIKAALSRSSVLFLLPHQIELLEEKSIDLFINISSLQEMTREQINHYYELINKKANLFYTKQWLSWENPEDKMLVPAVIYPTKPTWELISARKNPIHPDFFEAIFKM
jgi:putative sugar O-methyltransferase